MIIKDCIINQVILSSIWEKQISFINKYCTYYRDQLDLLDPAEIEENQDLMGNLVQEEKLDHLDHRDLRVLRDNKDRGESLVLLEMLDLVENLDNLEHLVIIL